jgi:hypothetical protein
MRLFTLDNVAGSISGVNCGVGGSLVKKQIIIIISKTPPKQFYSYLPLPRT